jgi:hypothetical protein
MNEKRRELPIGVEHLTMMTSISVAVSEETTSESQGHTANRKLIGTSLSALYQAATLLSAVPWRKSHARTALWAGVQFGLRCI